MAASELRALEELAPEWDRLADRVEATPWERPGWISAWLRAFAADAEVHLVEERRADRLAGVLPLVRRHGMVESPTNWHTPEFAAIAESDEVALALAAAALRDRPRRLSIGWIQTEKLEPLRIAAVSAGYRVAERPLMRSPFLDLETARAEASAVGSPLRIPRAAAVRRQRRKLAALGELVVDVSCTTDELDAGFRVEGSGWKEREGTAIASQAETLGFYGEVAHWAVERGTLRLFFVRLDSRPIAFVFALEEEKRLYYVKGGFDPEFRRFGPGIIVTHAMIEYANEKGLQRFEFLGGEDPWKLEWTDDVREVRLFQAFAPTARGAVEWWLHSRARPLAKRALARVR